MYTIKEIADILNIPITTLRYYERVHLINPKRGKNNYRYFDEKDILQIKYIKLLKSSRFSDEEIKKALNLLQNDSKECDKDTLVFLEDKKANILLQIHELKELLKMLELFLNDVDNNQFSKHEKTIDAFVEMWFKNHYL